MYIFLTSGVKLHIHLFNVVVQFIVFLTLSTLICRGTDISKCFSESLGIRDNESRLYFKINLFKTFLKLFIGTKTVISLVPLNINEMQMSKSSNLINFASMWNISIQFSPLDSPDKYLYFSE